MYSLDLETVTVGQEIAVDTSRAYGVNYIFCKVTRTTKRLIEVQPINTELKPMRFSKVTHKQLDGASWDHYRLISADDARRNVAAEARRREMQAERNTIKAALKNIADGHWTVDTVAELKALTDRLTTFVTD